MGGKQSCVRKTSIKGNGSGLLEKAANAQASFSFRYHLNKDVSADYIIFADEVLGTGANGAVLLARSREEGVNDLFALKRFQRLHDKKECEALVRESEIYLGLDHPHIARLLDVYETKRDISLVMEYCPGGEVFKRLKKRGAYKESYAREIAQQMLLAINYLHMKDLAHRDLKLENFMYDSESNDAKIKLIDFGFSCQARYKMSQACGSLSYVAPEVLGDKGYTKQCDMWSFGVICFLLLSGYSPFHAGRREHTIQRIFSGKYIMHADRWLTVSKEGRDFVAALLEVDPDKRMTATQALAHPWFSKLQKNDKEADMDDAVLSNLQSYANSSKFQRMCLNMMSWSLSNKERDEVLAMFKNMDKANEGWITLSEFKEALKNNFEIKDEEVLRIFKSMDLNNDEHIYYSDFVGAMCTSRVVLREDEIKMTFRKFDKDSTGMISRKNLAEALGSNTSGAEIDALLEELDTDNSGDISIEEFISYLSKAADGGNETITNIAQGVLETYEGIKAGSDGKMPREKPWLTRKPTTIDLSEQVDISIS